MLVIYRCPRCHQESTGDSNLVPKRCVKTGCRAMVIGAKPIVPEYPRIMELVLARPKEGK